MGRRKQNSPAEAKNCSVKSYKKEIIKKLQRDFCIKLSDEEVEHINSITRENDIDAKTAVHNAFVTILERHGWGE